MKSKTCPACGAEMKRNGKTKAGAQRWRCKACGGSATHANDVSGRELDCFLRWLLSKERQRDMPGAGRTFRRHAERFWRIWPVPELVDEIHRVVHVDGIHLSREAVVLVARSGEHVLSWHLARSETSRAYARLLRGIAPPEMVVTDGGPGFAKAAREVWPGTRVQRCLFHVFCQVRRYTTSRPKLLAGAELYSLAKDLLHVESLRQAELWTERFMGWCEFWCDFLEERTMTERGPEFTHDRLRKARRSVARVLNNGTLFTYLDPGLAAEGPMPCTNNRIEGGHERQDKGDAQEPQGHEPDEEDKGRVLALLHGHGVPEAGCRGAGVDADGRRHRPPARPVRNGSQRPFGAMRMGQRGGLGGAPS